MFCESNSLLSPKSNWHLAQSDYRSAEGMLKLLPRLAEGNDGLKVHDRQSTLRGEAVHEVLIRLASGSAVRKYPASPCDNHSRPKQRPGNSRELIFRFDCWYALLLIPSCFCALLAMSGCGDLVVNKANAGSLLPQPSTVNFGAVAIGQTTSTTVSLLNESLAPVDVTQLNLTGQPFSVVGASNLPITIASGGTYTLNLQFNPAAPGTVTGQLTIGSNSSTVGTPLISLSGTGTTGTGSAALSALSCSSGTMTGSGTDACTVTLTTSAPSGGLIVNLSSSNSAVTVPSTVTVPAGAASAGFTATVSSVATAQAVTMTASAGGVSKSLTLQLNAAILALSINATNVAFGDVVVNTPATQSVTFTSTGTVPVTIDGATLTGAGFTLPGATFPATLNPGQEATLNIEFDPTAVGAKTGQLTIDSNSSTNGTAVIGLSGTGTASPVVAVAVTPASASTTVGGTQQFAATVTGTSNTAVTWTVSGVGCTGTTCGAISSIGLYTAPAAVPSPATVTITATSVSDPTKSASATVTVAPHTGSTYYFAPESGGGNDSNNGLSPKTPWLTPNHSLNCGDVIIAAASTAYSSSQFTYNKWGTVTCPAGNNVAWLMCVTFDACKLSITSTDGFHVDNNYWGIQGWEVDGSSTAGSCFIAFPDNSNIHHIIFANNIANQCGQEGFGTSTYQGHGTDYLVIVGNIAYDTVQGRSNCTSGISIYEPVNYDTLPGTHMYVAGNFTYDNVGPTVCNGGNPTDGEGVIFDTFDGSQTGLPNSYSGQAVMDNNIAMFNSGSGFQVSSNNPRGANPSAPIYIRQNTAYSNWNSSHETSTYCPNILIYGRSTQALNNLSVNGPAPIPCSNRTAAYAFAYYVDSSGDTTPLNIFVHSNYGYANGGSNTGSYPSGFIFGSNNIFANPSLSNPVDPGAPSCGSYASVAACMATVIANFTPTNAAATEYGYQIPSRTPVYDPLFPQWLCNVNLPPGLVTMGCQTAP